MTSRDEPQDIGLSAALGAIRRELAAAMTEADAEDGPVRLSVSSLELELQTTLTRGTDLDGGIKVHVISAGAKRSQSDSAVQTVRIQLDARTASGAPVRTGDRLGQLPR
ncbi:trypco2 family protein [Streptomyces sp. NPDC050433]|uniref:trypco2 family protein n=1 Tax=unclassified Streptomyces TaxID=2593676 RepID=UPI003447D632